MVPKEARVLAVCLLAAALVAGCARRQGEQRPFWKFWAPRETASRDLFAPGIPTPPAVVMPTIPPRVGEMPKTSPGAAAGGEYKRAPATVIEPALRTVYFEFDRARLTDEAKDTLRENALWLREHVEIEAQLQGHCDERGTVEYNFNLGQRRADAVKMFLVNLGVSPTRVHTISYGEERPAVPGQNEEDWRLNRRVEFHIY